ncbi:MAG: sugar phosphate isomerase/epimerase [Ktedonobacteraceae bacterium]
MDIRSVALQLYTVRDEMAKDFAGTVRKVAALGYQGVEFAGYGGLTAYEMKVLLAETGVRAVSTHIRLEALEQDLAKEIAYCQEIGCMFLILPWLAPEQRTIETFRQLAPRLNVFGHQCQEAGITFGYHNHDFEFVQYGGETLMDVLLAQTEPTLVKLECDVYWAAYAGVNPSTFLRQHAGRVPLVHIKDMTPERTFAEVGDGTLDIASIIEVARTSGTQEFIVENDAPVLPSLESARRSLENIRAF